MKGILKKTLTLAAAMLAAAGCENPADSPANAPKNCDCTPKEQFVPCDCIGAGCDCAHIQYDSFYEEGLGNTDHAIPIFFMADVSDMDGVVANVKTGYQKTDDFTKYKLKDKIERIEIISEDGSNACEPTGTRYIIKLKAGQTSAKIESYLAKLVEYGTITQAQEARKDIKPGRDGGSGRGALPYLAAPKTAPGAIFRERREA
jgi:hypothetical protein